VEDVGEGNGDEEKVDVVVVMKKIEYDVEMTGEVDEGKKDGEVDVGKEEAYGEERHDVDYFVVFVVIVAIQEDACEGYVVGVG
jgi:hypothetical protein